MPNAVRHVLGVVAGLLLTPLLAVGLAYGVGQIVFVFKVTFIMPWQGPVALAACAVVLGVMAGSRLSPVASLLPGLTFTLAGGTMLIPEWYPARLLELLPGTLRFGIDGLGTTGLLFVLGVLLLTASAFPSRWRATRPKLPSPPQQPPSYPSAFTPFQPSGQGGDDQTRPMPR
ncbi:hypothetical protein ACFXJ8_18940 [Nonomuraea sp. NPDC059194]|uniref:hypothetical protein n=1 Tax=Nonomuraea sp. NPDC059194 TaxID=3346764 RepID=UPI0036A91733